MTVRRTGCAAAAAAAAVLLSGCGDLDADAVEDVASTFAAGDASTRCGLLAPNTLVGLLEEEGSACEEAIAALPLGTGTPRSVEVWGEEAQVKLADDTLFLTRTSEGWRVMAAACRSQGAEQPYDCQVEGA